MKTLIKSNETLLPGLSLFDDFLSKDLMRWTNPIFQSSNSLPEVNIKETNTNFKLEVASPGLDKKDFKVLLENNVLTVSANKESEEEQKDPDGKYTRREFSYTSFSRSFNLPPQTVLGDKISASYTNGILHISVPKREEATVKPSREIEIG
jgi:HSP20 family protein